MYTETDNITPDQEERLNNFYEKWGPNCGISTHNLLCSGLTSIDNEAYETITNHAKWLSQIIILFENIPICVSISQYGKRGDIYNPLVYVNKQFELTTQYSRKDIVGKNCNFLQGNILDEEKDTINELRNVICSGGTENFLITNYKKDSTKFRNLLKLLPIKYKSGEICYYMGIQIDLNDPKIPYNYILLVEDLVRLIPTEIDIEENEYNIPLYFSNMIELIGSFKNEPAINVFNKNIIERPVIL